MTSRRTILLVEDEKQVRNFLEQLLTAHSWTVTAVASGDAALAALDASDFALVLCDLDLGRGPSGLDVLSRIPLNNKATPFVFLTAHGSTGRCRAAFLLGATDFLEKPINPALLLSTLDNVISDSIGEHSEAPRSQPDVDHALDSAGAAGAAHVRRAIEIIEHRYAESDLTVGKVAAEVGVSPEHLARLFRARTGQSPLDFLHHVRIRRAEWLLAATHLSVYEVALECGYRRTSEFSSWFRRLHGAPPSESLAL